MTPTLTNENEADDRGDVPALTPLTKERIAEIIAHMRLMGGAPAPERMKETYVTRLNGLLGRGVLQVLDRPQEFESKMRVHEKSACSTTAYLKVVNQYMQTLLHTGRWHDYYRCSFDDAAAAYRQMSQDLNAREKVEAAARKRAKEAANKESG
jgi:hypothetical protein